MQERSHESVPTFKNEDGRRGLPKKPTLSRSASEIGTGNSMASFIMDEEDEEESILPRSVFIDLMHPGQPHLTGAFLLSSELWNIFRTIPRERISASETFSGILRIIKVLVYFLLFVIVLGSLIISKGSLMLMAGSLKEYENVEVKIPSHYSFYYNAFPFSPWLSPQEGTTLHKRRDTLVTVMVICLAVPHILTFIVHLMKGLFGSQPWPRIIELIQVVPETCSFYTGRSC